MNMDTGKYRIVVVDDDAISLKQARDFLNGDDMKVNCLCSGSELLLFLQKNTPDLILLDLMMPEMDGFEIYEKLCEYEEKNGLHHTPVIFMTGDGDSHVEQRGLEIGASDFIRKPFHPEVLLSRVRNIIANTKMIADLTEEATTDKLTGFYNKDYAESKMTELCKRSRGMLMILDLDNFKLVNDLYGHDMGDELLKAFADIAKSSCRAEDVFCRIGGDEFLAFFAGTVEEYVAVNFSIHLNEQIICACRSLMGEEFDIPVGVSIGCIKVPENGDYHELFKLADKALYQVKQNGRHGCHFYDTGVREVSSETFEPDMELKRMILMCTERGRSEKAMMVGQDAFIPIYRYMERFARRHPSKLAVLFFYLTAGEDVADDEFMDAMACLGNILQNNLRRNDVITKGRANGYYLLLPEIVGNDEKVVIERVTGLWEKSAHYRSITLGYVCDSVGAGG